MDTVHFNQELHRRLNMCVELGTAQLATFGDSSRSLADRLINNRANDLPLLSNVRVYRGAKDPDVNHGTITPDVKHGTVLFDVALGYASTANSNFGLSGKMTRGVGVLAEYVLPDNAIFYRNFGIEDHENGGDAGMSVHAAEAALVPHVERCMQETDPGRRDTAMMALQRVAAAILYEVPLPATLIPVRQWVVQYDDTKSRLIEFQDRGPVADVLIDAVRARKVALDVAHSDPFTNRLATGGKVGLGELDAFSMGLGQACHDVGVVLANVAQTIEQEAFSMPLSTVTEAIAWRKHEQQCMTFQMLGNSGFAVDHTRSELAAVNVLAPALDSVERAIALQAKGKEFSEIETLADAALALAERAETTHTDIARINKMIDFNEISFEQIREARSVLVDEIDQAYQTHNARLHQGFIPYTLYKFGGQKAALQMIESLQEQHDVIETNLDECSKRLAALAIEKQAHTRAASEMATDLSAFEHMMKEKYRDGSSHFLTVALPNDGAFDRDTWRNIGQACAKESIDRAASIAEGALHAEVFKSMASQGLAALDHNKTQQLNVDVSATAIKAIAKRQAVDLSELAIGSLLTGKSQDGIVSGKIVHTDSVANMAIIHVGRGMGKLVPLSVISSQDLARSYVDLKIANGHFQAKEAGGQSKGAGREHVR